MMKTDWWASEADFGRFGADDVGLVDVASGPWKILLQRRRIGVTEEDLGGRELLAFGPCLIGFCSRSG
jgi:hypothetical protein